MGWTTTYKQTDQSYLDFWQNEFPDANILDIATKGNASYMALQGQGGRVAGLVATFHKGFPQSGESTISYKMLHETEGPVASECPRRILEALDPLEGVAEGNPSPGVDNANQWRARCWHKILKRESRPKVKAGQTVRFPRELQFTNGEKTDELVFVKGSVFRAHDHRGLYRITRWRALEYEVVDEAVTDS